jgi:20S proteasome alpha/beta subunit
MTLLKRMLWRYQGHVGAALVLGGVDATGAHLYTIYPHGSTDKLPYATMGSGSLAAMAVFEAGWRPEMERAEAMELVHQVRSLLRIRNVESFRSFILMASMLLCHTRPSCPVSSTIWVRVPTWTWW